MLSIKKLSESANACMGWPYDSPGTNDSKGIDCSGLFVKMFRDQGAKIYHGSNTIFRKYCSDTGKLTKANQLIPGMAVFKRKNWTDADKDNRWYETEPGNLSHIGYVDSVNPLRIIHASTGTMCVTTDSSIKNWAYWGKLKNVDYSGDTPEPTPEPSPEPTPEPEPLVADATVWSESGKPVKMRAKPSGSSRLYDELPVGTVVTVEEYNYTTDAKGNQWTKISYGRRKGWYIMTKFLSLG